METSASILEFWFGTAADQVAIAEQQSSLWWSKNEATDRLIQQRFEPLVVAAGQGKLDDWLASATGHLALILLTDQFPRNIYRDTPQAFASDDRVRHWCKQGLETGRDRELRPVERLFFYLLLEHSEDRADQQRCVSLLRQLAAEVAPRLQPTFENFVDFALRHQVIVERFGRFPHRNAILGRQSTPEEQEFLQQPGSSF